MTYHFDEKGQFHSHRMARYRLTLGKKFDVFVWRVDDREKNTLGFGEQDSGYEDTLHAAFTRGVLRLLLFTPIIEAAARLQFEGRVSHEIGVA